MQKRYLPVAIMTGVLSAVALVGYILPVSGEDIPKRMLLPNAGGAVVFSHAGHALDYNIPCQTCHHESTEKRTNVQRCKTCHGVTFDAAFVKTHAASINDNAACVTCHHYETAPKKWGHERHQSELGLNALIVTIKIPVSNQNHRAAQTAMNRVRPRAKRPKRAPRLIRPTPYTPVA